MRGIYLSAAGNASRRAGQLVSGHVRICANDDSASNPPRNFVRDVVVWK